MRNAMSIDFNGFTELCAEDLCMVSGGWVVLSGFWNALTKAVSDFGEGLVVGFQATSFPM